MKIFRGVFITVACAAILFIFFDIGNMAIKEKYLFFIILFIGVGGMLLYFFDLAKSHNGKEE